jgi:GLPGLI family protein
MKKIIALIVVISSISSLHAQIKEGTITYQQKIDMYKRVTDEQMRSMMGSQYRTSNYLLSFSDSVSIYKTVPRDEMPSDFGGGGGGGMRMSFNMGGMTDNDILYKNFGTSKSVNARELGVRTYLVEDSIRTPKWKMRDDTKTILGHVCHKAVTTQTVMVGGSMRMTVSNNGQTTTTDTTKKANAPQPQQQEVIAWFADDILSPVGPENNGGLPGVILELNINGGETVYTATSIKNEVNKKDLKEPTKGKKVTSEEFKKMQMEAMQNQMQGMGGRQIRVGG